MFVDTDWVNDTDLPEGFDIDGLLGLSFLNRLDDQIRSLQSRMLVERAVE